MISHRFSFVLLGVGLALVATSTAGAATFPVSTKIGVYASPDVSRGISTISAGGTVDVHCWTYGQRIADYPIWDRVVFGGGRTGWVHDKYVQMPGGATPAANGIPRCDGGTAGSTAPASGHREGLRPVPQGNTIVGAYQTKYLSVRQTGLPDHSFTRVTWQARFTRDGGSWLGFEDPRLESLSAGSSSGVGIEFQAGQKLPDQNALVYRGSVRWCAPLSVGYSGIGFTGTACNTVANVTIRAEVAQGRVQYRWSLQETRWYSRLPGKDMLWTTTVL